MHPIILHAGLLPIGLALSGASEPSSWAAVTYEALDLPALELNEEPVAEQQDTIWDRLRFYGQGRQRAEATFDQLNGEDRLRGRMRFRVGATYEIAEGLRGEVRLTTRGDDGDARTPYWDFGDGAAGFDAAEIGLDRFYVEWDADEEVRVRFGKQPHAFAGPPVYSEYVWDEDLHPAGVTATWTPQAEEGAARFDLRGAGYIAVENGGDSDPHMLGLQANGWFPCTETLDLHTAISYADWSSLSASGSKLPPSGNTPGNGGFGILEGFVAASYAGGPLGRTQAFVQVVNNVEDDSGEDSGFAIGAKLGKSSKPGDWNVFASAFDFDANSLFGPVAQDDTPLAATGVGEGQSGVLFGTEYKWKQNVSLKLWAIATDVDADEDPFRVRFDLTFGVK